MAHKLRKPDRRSQRYRRAREGYEYEYRFWLRAELEIELGHDPPVLIRAGPRLKRYRTEQIVDPFWPRIRSAAVARELEEDLAETLAWLRDAARRKLASARRGDAIEVGRKPVHGALRSAIDEVLQFGPGFANRILERNIPREQRERFHELHRRFSRETGGVAYEVPEKDKDPDAEREKKRRELGERARSDVTHAAACALKLLANALALEGNDFWWRHMRNDAACRKVLSDEIERARTWLRITSRLNMLPKY